MNRFAMSLRLQIFAALIFSLTVSACGSQAPQERPPLAGAAIGGPFALVGKDGKTVRWQDFAGQYRIVYFGYTFCPDACPTDVATMMQGFARFEKAQPALAAQVQPIFITIDPARDTAPIVGEFAAAFSPRLIGLTGPPTTIAAAAKSFGAYAAKGKESGSGYLMDHTRIAYLMGRQGEPIAILPIERGPQAVEAELAKWVR
jgi:protein SCO1